MGLDVTAYKGLKKLDVVYDADGEPIDPETREYIDDCFQVRVNYDFPEQAEGLEDKIAYSYEDSLYGWSGGYGRYNVWREELAKLAGYPAAPYTQYGSTTMSHAMGAWNATEGPFHELILFSDCEGVIGPVVSGKLAKDFVEFDSKAKQIGEDFYERYVGWRECFEFASDNGVVDFH